MKFRVIEIACTVHPDEQVVWLDGFARCLICGHDFCLDERTTCVDGTSKRAEWGTNHYEAV